MAAITFSAAVGCDNTISATAHRAAGCEDAGLVRCFRKSLTAEGR